jgi:hypothetical protein
LLVTVVVVVLGVEWLATQALGLGRSQWTFFATVSGLIVALRAWMAWRRRARSTSRSATSLGRWLRAHRAWEEAHPVRGGFSDGLVIFSLGALWSLLLDQSNDLSVLVAAECGTVVFVFSTTVGLIGARRSRRHAA